tara:strand:- start:2893 stop:3546 length:654 start_codon:yes stop_codon:yes gene_type:complete
VGRDNQDVVDRSDVICLGVRPQDAQAALAALRFRSTQTVISFISTFSMEDIATLVQPCATVFRVVPLPPVARRLGPIAVFPAGGVVEEVFGDLGNLVAVADEQELQTLWSATSMMASYFRLQESAASWLVSQQVAPERARMFVASMFHALADTGLRELDTDFAQLAIDHATPGGLNEQLMRELETAGCFDTVQDGLALILRRMRGEAGFDDTLDQRL